VLVICRGFAIYPNQNPNPEKSELTIDYWKLNICGSRLCSASAWRSGSACAARVRLSDIGTSEPLFIQVLKIMPGLHPDEIGITILQH
jgi:hypothetical protein